MKYKALWLHVCNLPCKDVLLKLATVIINDHWRMLKMSQEERKRVPEGLVIV